MGARDLPRALIALAVLGLGAAAQTSAWNTPEQRRHREALRTERTAAFVASLGETSPRWEAARATLEAGTPEGAAAGQRPSLAVLGRALRALRGEVFSDPAEERLAALADSLDLQVVPGLFQASDEGRGEPLTVGLYPLWHQRPEGEVEISLVWEGPGGERVVARTEPFGPEAFDRPGFSMYLRSPLGPAGTWRLVPILRSQGAEVRGHGVAVDGVDQAAERLAAVLADGAAPDPHRPPLVNLLDLGTRTEGMGGEDLLVALEGGGDGRRPRFLDFAAPGDRFWHLPGTGENRRVILTLVLGGEDEDAPACGLEPWRALGDELLIQRGDARDPLVLERGLAQARRLRAGAEVVLVLRGPSVAAATLPLARLAAGEGRGPDRLVLVTPWQGVPRRLPDLPVRILVSGSAEQPIEVSPNTTVATVQRAPIHELRLPVDLRAWLGE